MIKVLLIDDEVWVCQLLRRLVDWESLGFCIVGEAHDGYEALRLLKKERPCLALTDIKMPGLDGVKLLRKSRELSLETQFLIISGYGDFGYAQEALKYGALGYLLKPVEAEELLEFLVQIQEKIKENQGRKKQEEEIALRLSASLRQLKEEYFRNLLERKAQKFLTREEVNRRFDVQFQEGIFRVAVGKADWTIEDFRNPQINPIMMTSLAGYLEAVFLKVCVERLAYVRGSYVVLLLHYQEGQKKEVYRLLTGLPRRAKEEQKLEFGYALTIGLGGEKREFMALAESYEEAERSVRMRIQEGVGRCLESTEVPEGTVELWDVFSPEKEKRLEYFLEEGDGKGAAAFVEGCLEEICCEPGAAAELIFEVCREVLHLFYQHLEAGEKEADGSDRRQDWEALLECRRIEEIGGYLRGRFEAVFESREQGTKSKNEKIIQIAKQYICENYREEISLKDLADRVCLNPKYFGELFKKETGQNYSDYLTKYRIETAESLLKDVRNRVQEVGYMVGYKDPKYFSRLFKKVTGLSPAQYRKLFS